jgi:hypothetical protein
MSRPRKITGAEARAAVAECGGSVAAAARMLGVARNTVKRRIDPEWAERRRERNREYDRVRLMNPHLYPEYQRYHQERAAAWAEANPERRAKTKKAWAEANPEYHKALQKAWREANREYVAEKDKLYYQANRERLNEQARARRAAAKVAEK